MICLCLYFSAMSFQLSGILRKVEPLTSRLPHLLPRLPEKLKGGRIERGVNYVTTYWKNVAFDYKAAVMEVYDGSLAKPKKAAFISSVLASALYMNKTNPKMRDFENLWTEYNVILVGVSETIMNKVGAKNKNPWWVL